MLSYERRYDPEMWLAGLIEISLNPTFTLLFGVKAKLNPLFPNVAGWHFNRLSAIGRPLRALMAFSEEAESSYSKKQYPFETFPSFTKLKNLSFPNVSQIFLTCGSMNGKGRPPKYILFSDPAFLKSFFLSKYFSAKNVRGSSILNVVLPSIYVNSG